jgi:hypothetical protein
VSRRCPFVRGLTPKSGLPLGHRVPNIVSRRLNVIGGSCANGSRASESAELPGPVFPAGTSYFRDRAGQHASRATLELKRRGYSGDLICDDHIPISCRSRIG